MDPLGVLGARPLPCVEGRRGAACAGRMRAGSAWVRPGSIRPTMPELACLLLRSRDEVGGGKAVGPAELYFWYPRWVSSPEDLGAAGAWAFLLAFLEGRHFKSDLEEEEEAGRGPPSSSPAPELAVS